MNVMTAYKYSVLLCACFVFAAGCKDPSKAAPAATVNDAAETKVKPNADGEKLVAISLSKTKVGFEGSKVTGAHKGGFSKAKGRLFLAPKIENSRVEIEIDTGSVFSDSEKLTGHLKSPDFFDVEKHPKATFTSTKIASKGKTYEVTGNLSLHGVTKSITFPATIQVAGTKVKASADFSINRKDFKIVYPGKPDDLIRDGVRITFDVEGRKAT